jgi:hypothetical protein
MDEKPMTRVIAGFAAATGFLLLADHYPIVWVIPLVIGLAFALYQWRRGRAKLHSIGLNILVFGMLMKVLLYSDFDTFTLAVLGILIQLILYAVLLFPFTYYWAEEEDRASLVLMSFLVLLILAACLGIGYLVTLNRIWSVALLGLWLLIFPKGLRSRDYSLLAALAGLIGLMLVITAVLVRWIDSNSILLAATLSLATMIVVFLIGGVSKQDDSDLPGWLSGLDKS